MSTLPMPLDELMRYHYDSREQLYGFVETLPGDEVDLDVPGRGGSILGLLRHGLQSEEYWIQHAILKHPNPRYAAEAYPDLPSIRALAGEVKSRTMQFVGSLDPDGLNRQIEHTYPEGHVGRFRVYQVLLQVATHDVYHRGQVLLLAMQYGHEVPDLDYL